MTDTRENDLPPVLTRRDLEARMIAKAWRDPAYRKALLKSPKAVLQRELGEADPSVVLPPALNVKVHEEAPNLYHLVLPLAPAGMKPHEVAGDRLAVAPQTVVVVQTNMLTVATVAVAPGPPVLAVNQVGIYVMGTVMGSDAAPTVGAAAPAGPKVSNAASKPAKKGE